MAKTHRIDRRRRIGRHLFTAGVVLFILGVAGILPVTFLGTMGAIVGGVVYLVGVNGDRNNAVSHASARLAPSGQPVTVIVNTGDSSRSPPKPAAPAAASAEPIETAVLRAANEHGGVATPSEVAVCSVYSLDEAKACLDDLVSRGHAELRVRRSGGMVYVFPDLLTPEAEQMVEPLT